MKKNIPVAVELLRWIWTDCVDITLLRDPQSWDSAMIGFFFSLRIPEIEDCGGGGAM